ncbi:universal stress protein, partial [Burkholderia pseudomallei]|nr:universal stress protein [Burkholderia pseudomallei]
SQWILVGSGNTQLIDRVTCIILVACSSAEEQKAEIAREREAATASGK